MPTSDIRLMIKDRQINIALLKELSAKYIVSLTAVACSTIGIYPKPAVLMAIRNNKVLWFIKNAAFNQSDAFYKKTLNLQRGQSIYLDNITIDDNGYLTNLEFIDEDAPQEYEVILSGFSIPNLNQKIILLVEY